MSSTAPTAQIHAGSGSRIAEELAGKVHSLLAGQKLVAAMRPGVPVGSSRTIGSAVAVTCMAASGRSFIASTSHTWRAT